MVVKTLPPTPNPVNQYGAHADGRFGVHSERLLQSCREVCPRCNSTTNALFRRNTGAHPVANRAWTSCTRMCSLIVQHKGVGRFSSQRASGNIEY